MTTLEQARLAGAAKNRNTSYRAAARAYVEAQGESTLTEIAEGLHWTRDFTRRTLEHAVQAGVLRVTKAEGGKRFTTGENGVKFPVAVQEKRVPHPERVAGLTYRQQLARDILKANEAAKVAHG